MIIVKTLKILGIIPNNINNVFKSCGAQGEPLSCFPFRAWAPGHPKTGRPRKECVVLTGKRYWETEDCSRRLPYICELVPDGPLSPVERYCAPINNISKNRQQLRYISVAYTRGVFWCSTRPPLLGIYT